MITLLVGHRGVGKSTLLKRLEVVLSEIEEAAFIDLDREVEAANRTTTAEIFKYRGEKEFRRLEAIAFEKLIAQYSTLPQVFIAAGAGFEFEVPEGVRVVWVRRPTDMSGRVFPDRPRLSQDPPLLEWKRRFEVRDQRFRHLAQAELMLPEGGLHDRVLEEFFFTTTAAQLPYALTITPQNLKTKDFLEQRKNWGIQYLELRDDLLSEDEIRQATERWNPARLLYSVRRAPLSKKIPGVTIDWALELGAPPFDVEIISKHERTTHLSDTLNELSLSPAPVVKCAVEVNNFFELVEGHRWWKESPARRAFLPRSKDGRWQWYRQLFGPMMPIHFIREGDGTAPDQPYLWQALTNIKPVKGFAAVLGSPVMHSWTPTFQREFFAPLGIPTVAIEVTEDEWESALPTLHILGLKFAAVTSPLKQWAFNSAAEKTEEAKQVKTVNTLAWSADGWVGHNTDTIGFLKGMLPLIADNKDLSVVVWGGGGTLEMMKAVLPLAKYVKAREGIRLDKTTQLVWAVSRGREYKTPDLSYVKKVIDLNYAENSPGREIALLAGCPYNSGEPMFIHQGLEQREFWKKYL